MNFERIMKKLYNIHGQRQRCHTYRSSKWQIKMILRLLRDQLTYHNEPKMVIILHTCLFICDKNHFTGDNAPSDALSTGG